MLRLVSTLRASRPAVSAAARLAAPAVGRRGFAKRYTRSDEWVDVDGDSATIGVSDWAQTALGDVVFVELPEAGDLPAKYAKGDAFCAIESIKAMADVYMPVSGSITAVNDDVVGNPALINETPEDAAWLIKVDLADKAELDDLLDADAYAEWCASRD